MIPRLIAPGPKPTIDGLMTAAVAIGSIYWNDQAVAQQLATFLGANLLFFSSNPTTDTPDYLVMDDGSTMYVALGGTTNARQAFYAAMSAAAIYTEDFPVTTRLVNPFWFDMTRTTVDRFVAQHFPKRNRLQLVGHSYGGAACRVGARQIQAHGLYGPGEIDVMTFGEPRSMDGRFDEFDDFRHLRICMTLDPIQYFPPNIPVLATANRAAGFAVKLGYKGLAFLWTHHGRRWSMPEDGGIFYQPEGLIENEAYNTPPAVFTYLGVPNHQMATGYLPFVTDLWSTGYVP